MICYYKFLEHVDLTKNLDKSVKLRIKKMEGNRLSVFFIFNFYIWTTINKKKIKLMYLIIYKKIEREYEKSSWCR